MLRGGVAAVGWALLASLYVALGSFDQEAYVREQEMELIQKGYIDPDQGMDNVLAYEKPRELAHDEEPEPGPLTPEAQQVYEDFMAR